MTERTAQKHGVQPLILMVPSTGEVSPDDWQSLWQSQRDDCHRVDLGMWENPHRNTWVNKLNLEIHRANRPVILVAHGLGCLAVAWWAEFERPSFAHPVAGALLVAPPDMDRPGLDPRLSRFGACPRTPLPFSSFLVTSHNDPLVSYRSARSLARDWGARFADAGAVGDIGQNAGLGDWPFGKRLLAQLISEFQLSTMGKDAQWLLDISSHAPVLGATREASQ